MGDSASLEKCEAEQMQDPAARAAAKAMEPASQVARLRMLRGLTQAQLAELAGTKQPCIARLESGKYEPRLSFLRRVVKALEGRLELRIVPQEEPAGVSPTSVPVVERIETP